MGLTIAKYFLTHSGTLVNKIYKLSSTLYNIYNVSHLNSEKVKHVEGFGAILNAMEDLCNNKNLTTVHCLRL